MATKKTRILTAVELEVMQALWDAGCGTVKDVLERLPKGRDLAYTSVATMLKILDTKKFVTARRGERAHTYVPLVSREAYEAKSVRHLVSDVFRSTPSHLVMRLINDDGLSDEELKSIHRLIEERLDK